MTTKVPLPFVPCACGLCDKWVDPTERGQRFFFGHQRKRIDKSVSIPCACGCGQMAKAFDVYGNRRKYIPGHGYKRNNRGERLKRITVHLSQREIERLREKSNGRKLAVVLREEALREAV